MSSRLEPMCTTLMIDYRSDVWAACKCVGALLRCVLIRTGTRTGPATAALTAGAMKPLSGLAAAAAAAQLLWALACAQNATNQRVSLQLRGAGRRSASEPTRPLL